VCDCTSRAPEFGDPIAGNCVDGEGGYSTKDSTLENCKQDCVDQASCIAIAFHHHEEAEGSGWYNCWLQTSCPDGPTLTDEEVHWSYYPLTRSAGVFDVQETEGTSATGLALNVFAALGLTVTLYGAFRHYTQK